MYQNLLKLFIFIVQGVILYAVYFLSSDGTSVLAIAPAAIIAIGQLGYQAFKYFDEKAEQGDINRELKAKEKALDDIQFTNKLKALTVPENIAMKEDIQRGKQNISETLTEQMGARGALGGITKADQAATNQMLKLTTAEQKAQYEADKAIQENEQNIDTMNKQKDMQQLYQEIYGLQAAEAESRAEQPTGADVLGSVSTIVASELGGSSNNAKREIGKLDRMLKNNTITQAEYDTMRANIINNAGQTQNPYTFNPNTAGAVVPGVGTGTGTGTGTGSGGPTGGTGGATTITPTFTIPSPLGAYDLDYDRGGWGSAGALFASNEYNPTAGDTNADHWMKAYEAWHQQAYPGQPVTWAGEGTGKLREFEIAVGIY